MATREDLDLAIGLARAAAALARASAGATERLLKASPGERIAGWDAVEAVTEADRAAQRLIVAGLARACPDDGIIGEESDGGAGITARAPRAGARTWVIDPIDGTNNYVAGLGCWAVCIGLIERGMPVLGVVHDVARDRLAAAHDGKVTVNGACVQACTTPLSDRSLIMLTSNLLNRHGRLPRFIDQWLAHAPWKLRMLGSAALEATQVGIGVAHAAITVNGKLWDLAAPAALVLAGGGRVTDFAGKDVFPYDVIGYAGSKIPFLAAAAPALAPLVVELDRYGWPSNSN